MENLEDKLDEQRKLDLKKQEREDTKEILRIFGPTGLSCIPIFALQAYSGFCDSHSIPYSDERTRFLTNAAD